MKIFTLPPRENWICDRIVSEWKKYCPGVWEDNPNNCDVIWLLAGWCWNHLPPSLLNEKKVLLTVHHIVPEKFDANKEREFLIRDQFVDAYHVPNEKTESFVRQLTQKPIFVIPYWFDPDVWKQVDRKNAREILSLPQNKFIIGSFQRDTEGGSKKPKLEKGPDLFCDHVERLSSEKEIHVLLGGWRRGYVIDRLESANIDYTFIEKAPLEQLSIMYNACDLYVVASRQEGGPQSILEASAMRVPIVSTDVGIANIVLDSECIFNPSENFDLPSKDAVEKNYQNVQKYSIVQHRAEYLKVFEKILL